MYSNSNIDNKIRGIIFCINLNSNTEKSSHISIESQAPEWFWRERCSGMNKDRNHVYSGVKLSKQDRKLRMCVCFSEGGRRSSPTSI